jgi:hypothetical protein
MVEAQQLAEAIAHFLHIGVPEDEIVLHHPGKGPARELGRGIEAGRQHVALEDDRARMVGRGAERAREPFERDRRFVPALVVPAFEHVEHRGPAVHRLGIAEGEGRDAVRVSLATARSVRRARLRLLIR